MRKTNHEQQVRLSGHDLSSGRRQPSTHHAVWFALCLAAAAFYALRPHPVTDAPIGVQHKYSCLANLSRIAQAFAQYAEDYDGKFPRGVDPEDRNSPDMWRVNALRSAGSLDADFSDDALTAPMLHELLLPYVGDRNVWHCPADTGWDESAMTQLGGGLGRLRNVRPSSWDRFGTSYYYLTIRGFAGWRPGDLLNPSRAVTVFDGDMWHRIDEEPAINVLYADGHVQNLRGSQFNQLMRQSDLRELQPEVLKKRLQPPANY